MCCLFSLYPFFVCVMCNCSSVCWFIITVVLLLLCFPSQLLFYLLPWQFWILKFVLFLKYTAQLADLQQVKFCCVCMWGVRGVGVLISKLHPSTQHCKSSFREKSFIIAWLNIQFPEASKVRINILIYDFSFFFWVLASRLISNAEVTVRWLLWGSTIVRPCVKTGLDCINSVAP